MEDHILKTFVQTTPATETTGRQVPVKSNAKGAIYVQTLDASGNAATVEQVSDAPLALGVDFGAVGINTIYAADPTDSPNWYPIHSYGWATIFGGTIDLDDATQHGLLTTSLCTTVYTENGSDNKLGAVQQLLSANNDALDATQVYPVAVSGTPLLETGAATLSRARAGTAANLSATTQEFAQIVTAPGEWAVNHTPAANTQATISQAAGGAGVRHVCKSITVSLIGLAAAAETTVLVNLRDGATGAGTILWSTRLLVTGTVGSEVAIALPNLNIVGSANTAMTLEFAAAGGASTFETVAMTGFSTV